MELSLVQILPTVIIAAVCHALALSIATRLMVEIQVPYRQAIRIVAVEYVAVGLVVGVLLALNVDVRALTITAAVMTYLFAGAACLGAWLHFSDGTRLGAGNGVLIQAIQIPLIIPVLILASYLIDLTRMLTGG
jgi:hypothetical protein